MFLLMCELFWVLSRLEIQVNQTFGLFLRQKIQAKSKQIKLFVFSVFFSTSPNLLLINNL